MHLGYCTNVHAGADLATTQANLSQHALAVKRQFSPDAPMGIGLWLSASAAQSLIEQKQVDEFSAWLRESGLLPFTLNGFPYGDFHQKIVKHDVYLPTWADTKRYDYTIRLIDILHRLLPAGLQGSISTLPVAWPHPTLTEEFIGFAAEQLRRVARYLARLEAETGRLIYLCIEPEPGCYLQTSRDMVQFFENRLLRPAPADASFIRRHLRVCHDVCHAAVMFENQSDVLQRFTGAGINVGKVQVSSAVCLPLKNLDAHQRLLAIQQLSAFAEDRYLHQTVVMQTSGLARFYEDLPLAIANFDPHSSTDTELRVHFHVPVYLEEFGMIKTSRDDILECLKATRSLPDLTHFEVETYAWNVLPAGLQQPTLADGIAAEMQWFAALSHVRSETR